MNEPETLRGKAAKLAIEIYVMVGVIVLILGMFAPFFIPWALRKCEETMPEGLTPDVYAARLKSRKTKAVIGIMAFWVLDLVIMIFAYYPYYRPPSH